MFKCTQIRKHEAMKAMMTIKAQPYRANTVSYLVKNIYSTRSKDVSWDIECERPCQAALVLHADQFGPIYNKGHTLQTKSR